MPVRDYCNMNVICCEADASVSQVAALMRRHHVGDVVVVDADQPGLRVPIGIVTDRDILVETISLDIDAKLFTAGDLMTSPVTSIKEEAGLFEAIGLMRNKKIRRLPVLTASGSLSGIITLDDVIHILASELSLLAAGMAEQTVNEGHLRK